MSETANPTNAEPRPIDDAHASGEFAIEQVSDATVELMAIAKVMPVLERQLGEVSSDIETSIVGVSRGFQGMAQRAQAAVAAASDAAGGSGEGQGADVISEMRDVVALLVQRIGDSCEFSQEASSRLAQIESRLEGIDATLCNIEEIARKARLVALNGQIESARLGEAGVAFGVVAEETKELSRHAADTSTDIRELVSQLVLDIKTTATELREQSEEDAQRLEESQQKATQLLADIDVSHRRMRDSLNQTCELSQQLGGDIAQAVMSLQFQDRVSQRIEHVIESLQVLTEQANGHAEPGAALAASTYSKSLLDRLAARYTMAGERQAHDSDEADDGSDDSDDVELF